MKKTPWIVRFLRWTLGMDDALSLKQPDFETALDMGILAMGHIADSDNWNTAEQIEAAKTGLLQICHDVQITHDEFLIGLNTSTAGSAVNPRKP
jgi:hypothetical protein